MSKKCIDCKHLNKELAFCRACGAKWLKETDGENCKYFEKITSPTLFDQITVSREELASNLVYSWDYNYYSTIIPDKWWGNEKQAYEATLAKLKEQSK